MERILPVRRAAWLFTAFPPPSVTATQPFQTYDNLGVATSSTSDVVRRQPPTCTERVLVSPLGQQTGTAPHKVPLRRAGLHREVMLNT